MSNQNQKRGRHRNGGGNNSGRRGNPARQNFDSNGPNVRIRGNATQVYEKYIQLARDAQQASDRVLAENLLQHAEHYYRILNTDQNDRQNDRQPGRNADEQRGRNRGQQGSDNAGGNGADQDGQSDESDITTQNADRANAPESNDADSDNAPGGRRAPAKRGRGRGRPPRRHQTSSDDQDDNQGNAANDGNGDGGKPETPDPNEPREAVGAD